MPCLPAFPCATQVRNALGYSYFNMDKVEMAIAEYEQAVELQVRRGEGAGLERQCHASLLCVPAAIWAGQRHASLLCVPAALWAGQRHASPLPAPPYWVEAAAPGVGGWLRRCLFWGLLTSAQPVPHTAPVRGPHRTHAPPTHHPTHPHSCSRGT